MDVYRCDDDAYLCFDLCACSTHCKYTRRCDGRGMHTLTRLFAAGAGIFRACAADYSFLACSEASPEFD
jgi:hypothetical protein